jgi:hypothetical protein
MGFDIKGATPREHVCNAPRGRAVVQSSTCSDSVRASSTSILR